MRISLINTKIFSTSDVKGRWKMKLLIFDRNMPCVSIKSWKLGWNTTDYEQPCFNLCKFNGLGVTSRTCLRAAKFLSYFLMRICIGSCFLFNKTYQIVLKFAIIENKGGNIFVLLTSVYTSFLKDRYKARFFVIRSNADTWVGTYQTAAQW